jgi:hypothetical protein
MTFTGHEDHTIPLQEASEWTANYRNANHNQTRAHLFGQESVNAVLQQAGCVGIRIYYAITVTGEKELVIVGVDANQNDLVNGIILDRSFHCPPECGNTNSLNS